MDDEIEVIPTPVTSDPAHAISCYCPWIDDDDAVWVTYRTACGEVDTRTYCYFHEPFDRAGQVQRDALCDRCFPFRDPRTYHPDPVKVGARGDVRPLVESTSDGA